MRMKNLLSIGVLLCSCLSAVAVPGDSVAYTAHPARGNVQQTQAGTLRMLYPSITARAQAVQPENPLQARAALRAEQRIALARAERPIRPAHAKPQLLPVVDHADIREEHKHIVNEVLLAMPERCRSTLRNFYVRYDNPKTRGLAGKNTLIISGNLPDAEFRALFIHELGHVFDLSHETNCLHGTPESGRSAFRDGADIMYNNDPSVAFYQISWMNEKTQRKDAKAEDFVTGYAAWDAYEDFAESFVYFVLHNEAFLQRATENEAIAKKYEWFVTHLNPEARNMAANGHRWNGTVPWDATKLPYEWQE